MRKNSIFPEKFLIFERDDGKYKGYKWTGYNGGSGEEPPEGRKEFQEIDRNWSRKMLKIIHFKDFKKVLR